MQIVVRGQNVPVSEALVSHCVDRARRSFRPFLSRISRATFVFVDLNGTRPGYGHACRATIELVGGGQLRYEGRAEDYYQSGAQTIAGTARLIQRALERRRAQVVEHPGTTPPAA